MVKPLTETTIMEINASFLGRTIRIFFYIIPYPVVSFNSLCVLLTWLFKSNVILCDLTDELSSLTINEYLYNLVPPLNTISYKIRNRRMFKTLAVRTESFQGSFFPFLCFSVEYPRYKDKSLSLLS